MRCFSFVGEVGLVEREVKDPATGQVGLVEREVKDPATGEAGVRTVWSPKKGWVEDMTRCLSVNAQTLDAGVGVEGVEGEEVGDVFELFGGRRAGGGEV
jgi:hypothetical protein